jgi:aminopeptidase N
MPASPTVRLADYQPPSFFIETVDLKVDIGQSRTLVEAQLWLKRNRDGPGEGLRLDGRELELVHIELDGRELVPGEYALDDEGITIARCPDNAALRICTRIDPDTNTSLEGLYKADSAYCTQCEAQGFRKITYFPDRPDVMARYSTTIIADAATCPVLLSNGNPVARGELPEGRHWMTWEDPFPKPSYLFALVAGDLACAEDTFTTASGREVTLRIYVERHNIDKCDHAMRSLKRAMRWDEEVYGLEYDLDMYMIVAVDDFNMGAMENKGLNVFNSKYVLARPDTATDDDFAGIEAVIAHEYFHNWTGNRVTCRDWFQLSLKEGLTVFRDQEFSADMGSRAVKRIQDVRVVRSAQFAEDGGPMAHPVRPEAYEEINNFYTVTIYNKGAEVIRMMHTLIGADAFRKGMDLYFKRHDGRAVTTDDFVAAMEDASDKDLSQFRLWYSQAGTPTVDVISAWDARTGTCKLTLSQLTPATPGQTDKAPMHIPVRIGATSAHGEALAFNVADCDGAPQLQHTLELRAASETFALTGFTKAPQVSVLRGFSAPVKIEYPRSTAALAFALANDADEFNRWDAGQTLLQTVLLDNVRRQQQGADMDCPPALEQAFEHLLEPLAQSSAVAATRDPALVAEALMLPPENYLADQMESIDVVAIHEACLWLKRHLATHLAALLESVYNQCVSDAPYTPDGPSAARRALKNASLGLLLELPNADFRHQALKQYQDADNMTDALAVVRAFAHIDCSERREVLTDFEHKWQQDSLVMDKWFAVQAASRLPGTLSEVQALLVHPEFDLRKPNKVRALIGTFAHANPRRFHAPDGEGYAFLAEQIHTLDPLNAQITARLIAAFSRWRRFPEPQRNAMGDALSRIVHQPNLSKDVKEMVSRTLGNS